VSNTALTIDLRDAASRTALERLHADVGAPVSARLSWLDAWLQAYTQWRPWVLALPGEHGEIRAVAALAERRYAGIAQIRCLGHTGLDSAPIVSRTPDDASDLAAALAGRLAARHGPWTMHLRQLPANDPFTLALRRRLPAAELHPAAGCPVVSLNGTADPRSRNLRSAEANARNRIARAGLTFVVRWIRRPEAVAERIPEIRAVHRARDVQLRGTSKLDDPREGVFYDALLGRHLDRLELLELRLNDELAAYLLWIRNGPARMVLDNRVSPRWSDYRAGLIVNNVALQAAAADPAVSELHWGAGEQRYKLQSASTVIPHEVLMAWSSPRMRWALARRPVTTLRHLVPV
jgi:Acetyltransferase (GNAT) domain